MQISAIKKNLAPWHMAVPTVVCHLVMVVGLKALMTQKISKIHNQEANQKHTNFI